MAKRSQNRIRRQWDSGWSQVAINNGTDLAVHSTPYKEKCLTTHRFLTTIDIWCYSCCCNVGCQEGDSLSDLPPPQKLLGAFPGATIHFTASCILTANIYITHHFLSLPIYDIGVLSLVLPNLIW